MALVTGSSRGIGAGIAKALAREGAHLVLVDVLECEEVKREIKAINGQIDVLSYRVNVMNREQVEETLAKTVAHFGRIDILVNNAGTCSRLDLEHMTDEMWERDINTNLRGTFLFMQAAIYPHMKKQRSGKIINISSISGIIGGADSEDKEENRGQGRSGPAYAASKGGIIALTKWVAKEVGSLGICCNTVAPGGVESDLTKGMNYVFNQPIKRMGQPEDIAEAVVYLASPGADFVTGQVLKVCGGAAIG